MRIKEIILEQREGSLQPGIARALPGAYKFPNLPNQDPYFQYRMGLAMASGLSGHEFNVESEFGEAMTVVTYTDADAEILAAAAKKMGSRAKSKKQISAKASQEAQDTNVKSPVAKRKKNKYGV
jgi:hypothetical protein